MRYARLSDKIEERCRLGNGYRKITTRETKGDDVGSSVGSKQTARWIANGSRVRVPRIRLARTLVDLLVRRRTDGFNAFLT